MGLPLDGLARPVRGVTQYCRFYYENPDYVFPGILPEASAYFRAESVGHPLLDKEGCGRCDIDIDAAICPLMMVTGSNMSGKSTLLRSVGVNAVLALAGAPVRAARLDLSPLRIACSISIHDSILDGKSRFQAEAERLRWIISAAKNENVLFLLDELLGGTNSAVRLCGAEAVIEQLINAGAVGLVTTHDLALTMLAENLGARAANVYFEDHCENGDIKFDYQPRWGKFRPANGRTILAALGLLPG